jgi:hypothetical protein
VAGAQQAGQAALHADVGVVDEPGRGVLFTHPRQAIHRGGLASVDDLIAAIRRFINAWNERCAPFVWTKDAEEILTKINTKTSPATAY